MKKGISLALCLLLATGAFVGCEDEVHKHTYAETWSTSATAHWHAATCKGHDSEKKDVDGHSDANNDGVCDVCEYVLCQHEFETVLTGDAEGHYYAATCGHDVKKDAATHSAVNAFGECPDCGYQVSAPDVSTVAKALALGVVKKSEVKGGQIVEDKGYSTSTIDYTFGEQYLNVATATTSSWSDGVATSNAYYSLDKDGNVFGLKEVDGVVSKLTVKVEEDSEGITAANLNGYEFENLIYGVKSSCGVEALIGDLYALGEANKNQDFAATVAEGVNSFSFGYLDSYDYLNVVSVSFKLDSATYAIKTANVKIEKYTEYDTVTEPSADADGVYAVKDGVEASTVTEIEINQILDNTVVNPYPMEEVVMSSYKLVDANDAEVVDTITMEKGKSAQLFFKDVAPATAIPSLTTVEASGDPIDNWEVFTSYEADESGKWAINISSYSVGEYDITLTINGVAKALKVKVVAAVPTQMSAVQYVYGGEDWSGEAFYVPQSASEITVYTGDLVLLGATFDKGEDQTYTATVDNEGQIRTKDISWSSGYEGGFATVYELNTEVAGEYNVTLTSNAVATLTETVKVTVKARPDMDEVLSGSYRYQNEDGLNVYTVAFSEFEDAFEVTYQVYEYDEEAEKDVLNAYSAQYSYEWDEEEQKFTTKFVNGYEFDEVLSLNKDYEFVIDDCKLEKLTEENALVGKWVYREFSMQTYEFSDVYYVSFNADGTGSFTDIAAEAIVYFNYTTAWNEDESVYDLTFTANADATNVGTTTAFDLAKVSAQFGQGWAGWMLNINTGKLDEYENEIWYNNLGQIEGEEAYVWPVELEINSSVNLYAGEHANVTELFFNAEKAGTYVVYANYWGSDEMVVGEFLFVLDGVKVGGGLVFEVEEAQRISFGVQFSESFDYDFYVDFEAAESDEQISGPTAAFTVTTDVNASANQGEYTYSIDANGNITVYNGSEVASFSETYALTFVDGVLTANSTSYPKTLTKYSDTDTSVLAGSWKYEMDLGGVITIYDFTFAQIVEPSNLTVTLDINQSANQGDYTWSIDGEGNITIYKDGTATDIYTLKFVDGQLTIGTLVMTKISDTDTSVLAGTWEYQGTSMKFYEFTFTGTGASAGSTGDSGDSNEAIDPVAVLQQKQTWTDRTNGIYALVQCTDANTISIVVGDAMNYPSMTWRVEFNTSIETTATTDGYAFSVPAAGDMTVLNPSSLPFGGIDSLVLSADGNSVVMTYNGSTWTFVA